MSAQTNAGVVSPVRPVKGFEFEPPSTMRECDSVVPPIEIDEGRGFRVWKRIDGSVDVFGEVDFSSAEPFRSALSATLPSTGIVWINMRGLRFLDSAGIRAIVSAANLVPSAELRLKSVTPTLRQSWPILGCEASAPNVSFCD